MSKKKKRDKSYKYFSGVEESTRNEIVINPDATLSPSDALKNATSIDIFRRDSTSASNVLDEDKDNKYEGTVAALADKHLLSKKGIAFFHILIVSAIVAVIIFITDNKAGLLIDLKAVAWTIAKCGIFFLLLFVFWLCSLIGRHKVQ